MLNSPFFIKNVVDWLYEKHLLFLLMQAAAAGAVSNKATYSQTLWMKGRHVVAHWVLGFNLLVKHKCWAKKNVTEEKYCCWTRKVLRVHQITIKILHKKCFLEVSTFSPRILNRFLWCCYFKLRTIITNFFKFFSFLEISEWARTPVEIPPFWNNQLDNFFKSYLL